MCNVVITYMYPIFEKKDCKLTKKEKDIIKFFIDNENTPAYQKQISIEAKVSERYLGDLNGKLNGKIKKLGRLSILVEKGILESKNKWVRRKGFTKWYFLREDFKKTKAYQEIASCLITIKERKEFLQRLRIATGD